MDRSKRSIQFDADSAVTRRRFGAIAGSAFAALAIGGAGDGTESQGPPGADGRIGARPRPGISTSISGTRTLDIGEPRDATIQIPANASGAPLPLLLLLHGAGGSGANLLRRLGGAAGDAGIAVLAPDSRRSSWDAIGGEFGPDVTFVNRALERVFETVAIDPSRVTVGGFSDGATYAVSLGLINGDLFSRVLAFSPGFVVDGPLQGRPRFFISHGTADPILPIDRCSRVIVARLRKRGYEVTFREFEGGHEVPAAIAREGMKWAG